MTYFNLRHAFFSFNISNYYFFYQRQCVFTVHLLYAQPYCHDAQSRCHYDSDQRTCPYTQHDKKD